jgi:hypothetical protein
MIFYLESAKLCDSSVHFCLKNEYRVPIFLILQMFGPGSDWHHDGIRRARNEGKGHGAD